MEENLAPVNLYVGNLPENTTEDSLRSLFTPFGTILRLKVAATKDSQNLGYGFVEYDALESAQKAIASLHGYEMNKKKLKVIFSTYGKKAPPQDMRTNLYISGFPKTYTKLDLNALLAGYGKIIGSRVLFTPTGEPRGVGLVRLDSFENAQKAIESLNGTIPAGGKDKLAVMFARESKTPEDKQSSNLLRISPPSILSYRGYPTTIPPYSLYSPVVSSPATFPSVSQNPYLFDPFATPSQSSSPATPSSARENANLYITGIPESLSKLELDGLFAPYGRIVASRILKPATDSNKGIGFVRLDSYESAVAAIRALNDSIPPKGTEKMTVQFARNQASKRVPTTTPGSTPPVTYGATKTNLPSVRFNPMARPASTTTTFLPPETYPPLSSMAYSPSPGTYQLQVHPEQSSPPYQSTEASRYIQLSNPSLVTYPSQPQLQSSSPAPEYQWQ